MKRGMLVAVLLAAGCGAAPEAAVDEVGSAAKAIEAAPSLDLQVFYVPSWRLLAFDLVGRGLNGNGFSGNALDDHLLAKVMLAGATYQGEPLRKVELSASAFRAGRSHGRTLSGEAMAGVVFSGVLDDGESLPVRIDAVVPGTLPSELDVVRYQVSYRSTSGWAPLCGTHPTGEPVLAVPLNGSWDLRQGVPGGGAWIDDPDAFTFACDGFVLAKCVAMGYAPWREGRSCSADHKDCTTKISLAPYHQACARMLRADYCGDGTSYTLDGTEVDSYDLIGVRSDSEDWALEAEWSAGGALCMARPRNPLAPEPSCRSFLQAADCGARAGSPALIVSEVQP